MEAPILEKDGAVSDRCSSTNTRAGAAARCGGESSRSQECSVIQRIYDENFVAHGGEKSQHHLNNVDGIRVARFAVERPMREMGLSGVRRGRSWVKTAITDDGAERPADLVDRDFTAEAPNRLWLADLTHVKAHAGWVYVAFIIDALEMAAFNSRRAGADLSRLVHHSDMGVPYRSVRYSQHLADNGVVASATSKGDSHDDAMIERVEPHNHRATTRSNQPVRFRDVSPSALIIGLGNCPVMESLRYLRANDPTDLRTQTDRHGHLANIRRGQAVGLGMLSAAPCEFVRRLAPVRPPPSSQRLDAIVILVNADRYLPADGGTPVQRRLVLVKRP